MSHMRIDLRTDRSIHSCNWACIHRRGIYPSFRRRGRSRSPPPQQGRAHRNNRVERDLSRVDPLAVDRSLCQGHMLRGVLTLHWEHTVRRGDMGLGPASCRPLLVALFRVDRMNSRSDRGWGCTRGRWTVPTKCSSVAGRRAWRSGSSFENDSIKCPSDVLLGPL